jgi:hypothetical protein
MNIFISLLQNMQNNEPLIEVLKKYERIRTSKIELIQFKNFISKDSSTKTFWQSLHGLSWWMGKNEIDPDELFEADISELSPELQQMIALLKELI